MAFCSQCGTAIGEAARFCPTCGHSVAQPEADSHETHPATTTTPARSSWVRQQWIRGGRGIRIRTLSYAVLALAGIAGSLFYGNQDVEAPSSKPLADAQRNISFAADANANRRDEAAERFAMYQECQNRTRPLVNELNELDSRLDVGLSFAEYGSHVGNLSVAYSRLRPGSLDFECLDAAVAFETAYRKYARAYNVWNDCIGDFGCSVDSIESRLQVYWLEAGSAFDRGKRALNGLR